MTTGMLTQEQLERARKRWNKPVQRETANPTLFEERVYSATNYFNQKNKDCLMTGCYAIINGRKIPIEAYGEIIVEDMGE